MWSGCHVPFGVWSTPLTVSRTLVLIVGFIYSILSERIDRNVLLLINVSSYAFAQFYFYSICTILSSPLFNPTGLRISLTAIGYFYNTFALRLIWATSLFDLIGGGKVVFDTLTLAMIAEAVPASSL